MWIKNTKRFKDIIEERLDDDKSTDQFKANIMLKNEQLNHYLMKNSSRNYLHNDFCGFLNKEASKHGINCTLQNLSTMYVKKENSRKITSPFFKQNFKCLYESQGIEIFIY